MIRRFTLTHGSARQAAELKTFLLDFHAFAALHPLMVKVENREAGHFVVHEYMTLPFNMKWMFQYTARVEALDDGRIRYAANPKGIAISIDFRLEDRAQGTQVLEEVRLEGFQPIVAILEKILTKAHRETFARLG